MTFWDFADKHTEIIHGTMALIAFGAGIFIMVGSIKWMLKNL